MPLTETMRRKLIRAVDLDLGPEIAFLLRISWYSQVSWRRAGQSSFEWFNDDGSIVFL